MKQTQNYQLSQWDKTDRIEMEDFNEDNRKIDAALAAEKQARENADTAQLSTLRSENVWAKLGEVILTDDSTSVTLPISNAMQYQMLLLQYSTIGCSTVNLRLNNGETVRTSSKSTTVIELYSSGYYAGIGYVRIFQGGTTQFKLFGSGESLSRNASDYYSGGVKFISTTVGIEDLTHLKISGSDPLGAGSRFILYGLKK